MNIAITFRQMEATDAVKGYASDKVGKLQKFLRHPMKSQVTLSCQKTLHIAEVDVHAGGEHFHATETTENMYASIDKVSDKLEAQIRKQLDLQVTRKKGADRASDRLLPDAPEDE